MTDRLHQAHETLSTGARFFATWLSPSAASLTQEGVAHEYRSRAIGNGLRELDRFLNILLDEVALHHGVARALRARGTARRLRGLRQLLGVADRDHDRLVALGRSRACLFHCSGTVRSGDRRDLTTMTLGWPDGVAGMPPRRVPLGVRVSLGRGDIESIAKFYSGIGDELMQLTPLPVHGEIRISA
ncbi:hypothetical protein TPR58_16255 [Sphingomonas sp. HF-S3]|uniref:Uncharacterized protein n=1 Tax=Sphingomonas rustica TaxID=3103142 RepID=A0ABV0BAZ1_9SPHN